VYLNTPEKGGETHFPNAKAKEGEEGLKIKPRTGMGVIHFPAYMHTSTYNNPAYPNMEMGCKVKHKERNSNGDVVSVNSDGIVTVQPDAYSMAKVTCAVDELDVLENMHGEIDGRGFHAGMPASDEKFLLSQWCWPGPFDFESTNDAQKSLDDGIVL
jgi:hypothetical protein